MLWTAKIHPLTRQIVRWACICMYESPRDICCKVKSHRLHRDQTGSQSICTCCYRNGDDRHHSAVQRAEIERYCQYDIYRLYLHQLPPVRPRNSFFSEFHTNFFHPPSSLFWAGMVYCKVLFIPLGSEFPSCLLSCFLLEHYTPSWSTKLTVTWSRSRLSPRCPA